MGILDVLGVTFLVVIALVLVAVIALFVIIYRIKKFFKNLAKTLGSMNSSPSEIRLVPDPSPSWLEEKDAKKCVKEFESLKFSKGFSYLVEQMPGVCLQSFCSPDSKIIACLYKHPSAGIFADLCANFSDGKELTVSNAPSGSEIDHRPETEKIFMKGSGVGELHDEIRKRTANADLKTVSNESFANEFQSAYRKDMAWRNERGGVSEEEILRVAENSGKRYGDRVISDTMTRTKFMEIVNWSEECLENFENSTEMSESEWEAHEDSMLVFKDEFHPLAYLEYLSDNFEIDAVSYENYKKLSEQVPLRELLATICREKQISLKKLGEVEKPLKAEIYLHDKPLGYR